MPSSLYITPIPHPWMQEQEECSISYGHQGIQFPVTMETQTSTETAVLGNQQEEGRANVSISHQLADTYLRKEMMPGLSCQPVTHSAPLTHSDRNHTLYALLPALLPSHTHTPHPLHTATLLLSPPPHSQPLSHMWQPIAQCRQQFRTLLVPHTFTQPPRFSFSVPTAEDTVVMVTKIL